MTEMVNGEGQSSSNFAPATPVNTPSSTPSAPVESERTFKQSEVNELVGRAKHEAIERYKNEGSMANRQQPSQQPAYQPQQQGYGQQPQYQPQQPNAALDDERVKKLAAEETQRLRNEWIEENRRNVEAQDAQRIASEFFTKVGAGEGGIAAFEKTVASSGVDLRSIPYHVQLANQVDNTREVMEELLKNPSKIGAIQNLIDIDLRAGRTPNLAMAEIKRMSESIKTNDQASKFKSPNDPLRQLPPSNAASDNKGAMSVSDYKRKYRV